LRRSFTLVIIFFILITTKLGAQQSTLGNVPEPYKISWSQCFGGSAQDIGFSMCEFDTSEVLIASYTYSNDGTISTPVYGNADWWAMKLTHSATPKLEWSYTYGGSEYDKCRQITSSYNHKSYALFGTTHSRNGDIDSAQLNGQKIRDNWWLVKINDSGRILKQKLITGGGNENNGYLNLNGGRALLPTADNGYILCGWSTADSGDFTGKYPGIHTDSWLFKVDSDLNIEWKQHYGGSGIDAAIRIIRAGNYYYFTGETTSNDYDFADQNHLDSNGVTTADFGVWKTDTMGNLIWAKSPGGSGVEFPFDIHEDWDGNIVCAGYTSSNDGDVTGNHGGSKDGWLFKLRASDGSLMWQKCFGGGAEDAIKRILPMPDHGFTLLCTSASKNGDGSGAGNNGSKDVWLLRVDSNLNIMYSKMFGGSDSEEALDLMEFPGQGYLILASTSSIDGDLQGVKNPTTGEDDWLFFVTDSSLLPATPKYHPMFGYNHTWYVENGLIASSSHNVFDNIDYRQMFTRGDTIINHNTYYKTKIDCCPDTTFYFREDTQSRRVWMLTEDTMTEKLIYDFSLNKGDSIFLNFDFNDTDIVSVGSGWYFVDSVKYISTYSGQRKALFLSNPDNYFNVNDKPELEWIEQMGSTIMPDYLQRNFVRGGLLTFCNRWEYYYIMLCSDSDNVKEVYHNHTLDGCVDYTDIDSCSINHGLGITKTNQYNLELLLNPNPANSSIQISAQLPSSSEGQITIFNSLGAAVKESNINRFSAQLKATEDISNLSQGIYFIEIKTKFGIGIAKFVKQ
jgi:hypothetical protein